MEDPFQQSMSANMWKSYTEFFTFEDFLRGLGKVIRICGKLFRATLPKIAHALPVFSIPHLPLC